MVLWESRATFHYDARCLLLRFYIQQCQSLHLMFMQWSKQALICYQKEHLESLAMLVAVPYLCLRQKKCFVRRFLQQKKQLSRRRPRRFGGLQQKCSFSRFLFAESTGSFSWSWSAARQAAIGTPARNLRDEGNCCKWLDTVDWDSCKGYDYDSMTLDDRMPRWRRLQWQQEALSEEFSNAALHFPIALPGFNSFNLKIKAIQPSSNWWQERRAVQRLKASLEAPSKRVAQNGRRDVHHSISNEYSEGWHTWEILGEVTVWLWGSLRWWETGSFVKACTGTLALGEGKTCSLWSRVSGWMRWSCFLVKLCPTQNKHALAQPRSSLFCLWSHSDAGAWHAPTRLLPVYRTVHTQFTYRFQHFFAASVQCYAMLCLSICVFYAPQSEFNLVHSHHECVQLLLLMMHHA